MFKLNKGDKVGIISPSSCLEGKTPDAGINYLKSLGLEPVTGQHMMSVHRYTAGTDQERADDINAFFADKQIKAVFCTRGGAGSLKTLPKLDFQTIKENPKPIFGLSDSTALQNGIYAQTKNISYTGFLLSYDFRSGSINPTTDNSLKNILNGLPCRYQSGNTIRSGIAEGELVGGNMYAFCSLCGTPYFPDLSDKILVLEEIGEKSYKLDLMLNQLSMQPGFNRLKGIIFGSFEAITVTDTCDGSADENIEAFAQELSVPAIKNFQYGHIPARHILPIGKKVRLDAGNCLLSF